MTKVSSVILASAVLACTAANCLLAAATFRLVSEVVRLHEGHRDLAEQLRFAQGKLKVLEQESGVKQSEARQPGNSAG